MSPQTRSAASPRKVEILFVGEKGDSAWLGAMQGLNEANVQGKFLNTTYTLTHVPDAAELPKDVAPAAVVVAADAPTLKQVSEAMPDTPVFNVSLEDDELRAQCLPNTLHVIPSKSMQEDAVSQWKSKKPDSQATARAWHSSARKYAGTQLNRRYEASAKRPMDDRAWAGWAAVKMLSDTMVRVKADAEVQPLEFMKTELQFDGQKGTDQSFRPNGQLRQPLLLVEGDKIVGEAPVASVTGGGDDLDTLGESECAK
jgi:hypothetical protein